MSSQSEALYINDTYTMLYDDINEVYADLNIKRKTKNNIMKATIHLNDFMPVRLRIDIMPNMEKQYYINLLNDRFYVYTTHINSMEELILD